MTVVEIRERGGVAEGFSANIRFDGTGEYDIHIRLPFSAEEESDLSWYFEESMSSAHSDPSRAASVRASVRRYGEALFQQVFADPRIYARYSRALHEGGAGALRFTIAGSPDFHRIHWETIWDPALAKPFSVETSMVRQNLSPQVLEANVLTSPTINLLLVAARPSGAEDVCVGSIARPLISALRQASLRVRIDILRPATYEALEKHLQSVRDDHGSGFYHVVHFDVHGGFLSYAAVQKLGQKPGRFAFLGRFGRRDAEATETPRGFIFLEGESDNQFDPVEAGELAGLLMAHQVPIVILNSCKSGKQVEGSEVSLGSRLVQAGVQVAVTMSYSITFSAARVLMAALYQKLFEGKSLSTAIRHGRLELYNRRGRFGPDLGEELEDWLLPVVYQNREVSLTLRDFTEAERTAWYEALALRSPVEAAEGGWGRDSDILLIERHLLRHNLLLVRFPAGTRPLSLRVLGRWWQTTGFVWKVLAFDSRDRAWSLEQILGEMAQALLDRTQLYVQFESLGLAGKRAFLAERLRGERHLIILDLSAGSEDAVTSWYHLLSSAEREALRSFLGDLQGGKSLVILGSGSLEEWLAEGTFGSNLYELPPGDAP